MVGGHQTEPRLVNVAIFHGGGGLAAWKANENCAALSTLKAGKDYVENEEILKTKAGTQKALQTQQFSAHLPCVLPLIQTIYVCTTKNFGKRPAKISNRSMLS